MPDHTEDLTGVMWQDKNWLTYFPLDETTVLDYFSLSQFYDGRCNNELIKMQRLDKSLLETMPGIEYGLTGNPSPGLFIITKAKRSIDPPKLEPLATYYIHDGDVYQAPSMHAILSSRVLQSVHHLRKAFESMHNATVLSEHGKYVWEPPPVVSEEREDTAVAEADVVSVAERRAIDRMLFDVLQKNRTIAASQQEKSNVHMENDPESGDTLVPPGHGGQPGSGRV